MPFTLAAMVWGITACAEESPGFTQDDITAHAVNRLAPTADPEDANARRLAIRGANALRARNVELLVTLAPPAERDQLRRRLQNAAARQALFDPGGWRSTFLREWDGRAYELAYPTPSEAWVTLGAHRDQLVVARLLKREGQWRFQGLMLHTR